MIIHNRLSSVNCRSPVVAFGTFDGVHLGHRQLLSAVRETAVQKGTASVVMTFWPHPRLVLGQAGQDFRLLNSLGEKSRLIAATGIDHLIVVPFTGEFASIGPEDFVRTYLWEALHPACVLVGEDVRYGTGGKGDISRLIEMGLVLGFEVLRFEPCLSGGERISSTGIRSYLQNGDLEKANAMLGYPYSLNGTVTTGNRIGNTIGFPTANILVTEEYKQIPCDGVYAVRVGSGIEDYDGMLNIGIRPTIPDQEHKTIEVHLFGAAGDLYGEQLEIRFIARLRNEMKFNSLEELRLQLVKDRAAALEILPPPNSC